MPALTSDQMIKNPHDCYAKEACERRLARHRHGDEESASPQTHRERIMVETAYRRGYQQGVEAMHRRWLLHPAEWKRQSTFLFQVYKWRFCKHNGRFTRPPE